MENELNIIDKRELLGKQFKIYGDLENPLFLAKDVASWIEHTNVTKMLLNIDDEEKLVLKIPSNNLLESLQKNTEYTFLTEDGLYEVLMLSRKPIAKEFKKEVKKILKLIRKTGIYLENDVLNKLLKKVYKVGLQHYIIDLLSPRHGFESYTIEKSFVGVVVSTRKYLLNINLNG